MKSGLHTNTTAKTKGSLKEQAMSRHEIAEAIEQNYGHGKNCYIIPAWSPTIEAGATLNDLHDQYLGMHDRRENLLEGTILANVRRGRLEIIADIMEVCSVGGACQTRLINTCSLSTKQIKPFINFCISQGFLEEKVNTDGNKLIKKKTVTTMNGRRFLSIVRASQEMLRLIDDSYPK